MRFAAFSKSVVLALAVIASTSAFASAKGSLQLTDKVSINGTTLKPGDYKVEWDGAGPNVEVSIMRGKDVLAKVPAHIVELPTPADNNAAVTRNSDGGSKTLAGVRFGGKKITLEFNEATDTMSAGASR